MTDHLQSFAGQNELLFSMFNTGAKRTRKYNSLGTFAFIEI